MRRRASSTLGLLPTLLTASCGLFPTPNWLDGKIADGTYSAPDGDFTVKVPHTDAYERTYMAAKERGDDTEFYVSFGPAAFDKSIYRLAVVKSPVSPLPAGELQRMARGIGGVLSAQLEPMTGEKLVVAGESPATVGSSPAYRISYTQHAPAGTVATDEATILHESYMIQRGDRVYSVWVQTYRWQDATANSVSQRGISAYDFADSVAFRKP
ncbi:MAG: hypothetical protein U1E73_06155 [Planctomycetota bacterium]